MRWFHICNPIIRPTNEGLWSETNPVAKSFRWSSVANQIQPSDHIMIFQKKKKLKTTDNLEKWETINKVKGV